MKHAACYLPFSSISDCLLPLFFTLIHHHRVRLDVDEEYISLREGWLGMQASSQHRMPDIAGAVISAPGTSSSQARNPGNELRARLGCSKKTMNSDVGRKQLM